ncbi:MAG TPA: electron transport complex subunit E [Candidatus Ornithospirochaeta stercorigallinarum]|nr:electron transport complex subunit E [Candidatus Ornithospirochaeta stercorigallinarum]
MSGHMKELTKGLFKENPTFIIMLGMCPTLGVSTQVSNALGMGLSVIFVLTFSNMAISALRKIIPDTIRIPSYIVIIASFVTIVEMVLHAYVPSVYSALGVYLPLIVVNCIILGRAEAFANKNTVLDSALDGIGMGVGFTMSLTLISLIREVFGSGTITLFAVGGFDGVIEIPGLHESPIGVLTLASGALLVMGYLKAFFQWKSSRGDK